MTDMVSHQRQMKKFGWYGLLKNLKLFEPYLLLYFLLQGLTFTEIGILYAIREIIIYVLEIPSGVIADRFGKKRELLLSFAFYIGSFLLFFLLEGFWWMILPMTLFALGEAFRSGTHKAMIMEYLDIHQIKDSKKKVYGYTRSYSNVGSFVSSLLGIGLVLFIPRLNILFLVAIVPYVIDAALIWSYPDYLNQQLDERFTFKQLWLETIASIRYVFQTKRLFRTLLDSSAFNALFKTMRDFIQPLIYTVGLSWILITQVTPDANAKVVVGLTFAIVQLVSVFATKYAYLWHKYFRSHTVLFWTWMIAAFTTLLLGVFTEHYGVLLLALFGWYLMQNIRKPYMVERIGTFAINERRSSVLSIESQASSLWMVVFAPVMGWIADSYGLGTMVITMGVFMVVLRFLLTTKKDA